MCTLYFTLFFQFYSSIVPNKLCDSVSSPDSSITGTYIELNGQTQGTTYKILYKSQSNKDFQHQVDSILALVDNTLSLYNRSSIVSRINDNEPNIIVNSIFEEIYGFAREISENTEGAFDITAGNAYHLQFSKKKPAGYFTYKDVELKNHCIIKSDTSIKLDFNGIAQGLTVDLISEYFLKNDINNFIVEIGGELRCNGKNQFEEDWKIGIDNPQSNNSNSSIEKKVLRLTGKAVSTSGNYRNYIIQKGKKYGHIINPSTRKSAETDVISATVVVDKCYLADGYATVFVVMGLDKSLEFLKSNSDIQAIFMYKDIKGEIRTISTKY